MEYKVKKISSVNSLLLTRFRVYHSQESMDNINDLYRLQPPRNYPHKQISLSRPSISWKLEPALGSLFREYLGDRRNTVIGMSCSGMFEDGWNLIISAHSISPRSGRQRVIDSRIDINVPGVQRPW